MTNLASRRQCIGTASAVTRRVAARLAARIVTNEQKKGTPTIIRANLLPKTNLPRADTEKVSKYQIKNNRIEGEYHET
jgi:hypothetical protein